MTLISQISAEDWLLGNAPKQYAFKAFTAHRQCQNLIVTEEH